MDDDLLRSYEDAAERAKAERAKAEQAKAKTPAKKGK